MIELLHQLFAVIWRKEFVPPHWREGPIVNLFKRASCHVITGKVHILNTRGSLRIKGGAPVWLNFKQFYASAREKMASVFATPLHGSMQAILHTSPYKLTYTGLLCR